jgi:hypothetical protein
MTDSEYGAPTENTDAELWREAFIDAGAETLADIRQDWDCQKQLFHAENRQLQVDFDALLAPLRERVAKLEGQIEMLASLLNADAVDSRAKSKRLRQQQDNGSRRLLEAPQTQ